MQFLLILLDGLERGIVSRSIGAQMARDLSLHNQDFSFVNIDGSVKVSIANVYPRTQPSIVEFKNSTASISILPTLLARQSPVETNESVYLIGNDVGVLATGIFSVQCNRSFFFGLASDLCGLDVKETTDLLATIKSKVDLGSFHSISTEMDVHYLDESAGCVSRRDRNLADGNPIKFSSRNGNMCILPADRFLPITFYVTSN